MDATEDFNAIHSFKAKAMLKVRSGGSTHHSLMRRLLEVACLNAGGRETEVVSNPSIFLPIVAQQDYYVGRLDDNKPSASQPSTSGDAPVLHQLAASHGELVTLNPREKVTLRLAERIEVSQNSRIFRFALSSPQQRLGLPCGKHVYVYAKVQRGRHDTATALLP